MIKISLFRTQSTQLLEHFMKHSFIQMKAEIWSIQMNQKRVMCIINHTTKRNAAYYTYDIF